jgi:hypothetical protein
MNSHRILALLIAIVGSLIFIPTVEAKLRFGANQRVHFVQEVSLRGPNDEQLFLGRMIETNSFLLPYAVKDQGFVLGIAGESARYFDMPPDDALQAMQREGLLPAPLPTYELTAVDLIFGNLLWIVIAVLALYGAFKHFTSKQTQGDPDATPVAGQTHPAPKMVTAYEGEHIELPMTLHASKLKMAGLVAISAVFVAIGIFTSSKEPVMGLLSAGFFGLCGIVGVLGLIPGGSYLLLERDGFTTSSLFRKHSYRWRDVSPFGVKRISRNKMVCWNFAPNYSGPKRGASFSKTLTGIEAALPDTYGKKAEDLAELMNELRQRA